MLRWLANPMRERSARPDGASDAPAFHRALAGYEPTPLLDAPTLAREWDVGAVRLKFERERFGLPSFKYLGASWAVHRLLGEPPYEGGQALIAATDGNHGRAVARIARLNGLAATILVPAGTVRARIAAIEDEGAEVIVVEGTYDDAVRRSAELAGPRRHLISDTSWPGYEQVPGWVIEGYATIFAELGEQLDGAGLDLTVVPIGVGALAAAAARNVAGGCALLGVEPADAACLLESAAAGRVVELPGSQESIMAGLNCATPSLVAFPEIAARFDAFSAIADELAIDGMRRLAALGIAAGECSGGSVGAAGAMLAEPEARAALGVGPESSVCVLLTEAVTDPELYARVVSPAE